MSSLSSSSQPRDAMTGCDTVDVDCGSSTVLGAIVSDVGFRTRADSGFEWDILLVDVFITEGRLFACSGFAATWTSKLRGGWSEAGGAVATGASSTSMFSSIVTVVEWSAVCMDGFVASKYKAFRASISS